MKNVTVLGLGIMGSGVASNILQAGFNLTVYNRSPEKMQQLAEKGATTADTPREAVENADVIITVISNDAASRAIWTGDVGILAGARDNAICIECSTLTLDWTHELAELVKAQGLRFLDSPLGGSKEAAAGGNLALFVGGDAETVEAARPVLESFSRGINHAGDTGAGMAFKLVVNHLVALEMLMLAEGLNLAENLGINRESYFSMIENGALGSTFMKRKAAMLRDHSYEDPHFMLRWMRKDLSNILQAADSTESPLPLGAVAREIYQMAQANGLGDMDFAAIYRHLRSE